MIRLTIDLVIIRRSIPWPQNYSVPLPRLFIICVSSGSNSFIGSRVIKFRSTAFLWPSLPGLELWSHDLENVISITPAWYWVMLICIVAICLETKFQKRSHRLTHRQTYYKLWTKTEGRTSGKYTTFAVDSSMTEAKITIKEVVTWPRTRKLWWSMYARHFEQWWPGVAVAGWSRSTNLTYVGPG